MAIIGNDLSNVCLNRAQRGEKSRFQVLSCITAEQVGLFGLPRCDESQHTSLSVFLNVYKANCCEVRQVDSATVMAVTP